MYVLKIQKTGYGLDSYVHRETGSKRGGAAPWTITWSCVFLDQNLKLSPNRALLKWCFPKVATLRWRLLLRPLVILRNCNFTPTHSLTVPQWWVSYF
jgi:hypothetical protein